MHTQLPQPNQLPPYYFVNNPAGWQQCLADLSQQPRLAIDLEANSLYAYREQICLIQLSTPHQDYILDPFAKLDLNPLAQLITNPAIEKILHAAEYDLILLKQEHGWQLENLFDTYLAARILGFKQVGLANMLKTRYNIQLDKSHQRANWGKRPLTPSQLNYAQADTHYLFQLRDDLYAELSEAKRLREAEQSFAKQCLITPQKHQFDPDNFWSINGAYDLPDYGQATLKQLYMYRNEQAAERNMPPFKIFSDQTLLELARRTPLTTNQLRYIHGMTSGQVNRYGADILKIVEENLYAPPPPRPRQLRRPSTATNDRFMKLQNWRKERAQIRGVDSDIILSREVMWAIAKANPLTLADLSQIQSLDSWRLENYGEAILQLLTPRKNV